MEYEFTNPIYYFLVSTRSVTSIASDFKKITDYLLTFVGEIGLKTLENGSVLVSYNDTPQKALLSYGGDTETKLKLKDTVVSRQILLTCEKEDVVSVNLLKNVTKITGLRIYNPTTESYLVGNPQLLDLTTGSVPETIKILMEKNNLTPLFQYQNALVFYAKDKKGSIHLVNRHLLEYLINQNVTPCKLSDFSMNVSKDIGRFIALFDRGLVPISYYDFKESAKNIVNQSGFNLDKALSEFYMDSILFNYNSEKQSFDQLGTASVNQRINVKKGESAVKLITKTLERRNQKYLSLKFAGDVKYVEEGKKLIPKLSVSVYLDS